MILWTGKWQVPPVIGLLNEALQTRDREVNYVCYKSLLSKYLKIFYSLEEHFIHFITSFACKCLLLDKSMAFPSAAGLL